jgi:CubicO group peptidase (beta-lactamase class C family)
MRQITTTLFLLTIIVTTAAGALAQPAGGAPLPGVLPHRDYWPTSDWRSADPARVGMSAEALARAEWFYENLFPSGYSLLVIRNGHIVMEAYFNGADRETRPHVFSISKSVMSALTGIAIAEGLIGSVDQPVLDFFPEYATSGLDPWASDVTLRHVLTHTSGLLRRSAEGDDWLRATLQGEMAFEPGSQFSYSNAAPDLLSGIISRRSGMDTFDYARTRLFSPLGIRPAQWDTMPTGVRLGANGLYMSARELARLGFLYLNDGMWDGKRILPAGWVDETRQNLERFDATKGYGYLTWVWSNPDTVGSRSVPGYFAYGHRGQYIGIYPELDLLVVTSADATDASRETYFVQNYIHDFVRLFIFPAIEDVQ